MPRALLADDEPHLLDYLEQALHQIWPQLQIIAKVANGIEALRLIDEQAPDIAFLDIRMPGLTGLQVAQQFPQQLPQQLPQQSAHAKPHPHIVFVTAYEQYAIDAFEHCAIDYLLKPPSAARLEKTVRKLQQALQQYTAPTELHALLAQLGRQYLLSNPLSNPPPAPASAATLQWIRAAHGEQTRLIAVDEVIYFQSNDKYTSVFTNQGESLIRTPLREIYEQLDNAVFWQIHRSTVVSARHIAGTRRDFRGRLLVQLKTHPEELVVSRNYVDLFKQM
jgi:DNA-binding LytR/AlgR family response regulator